VVTVVSTLRERREAAHLTLADVTFELRFRLGRSAPTEATISRWESGKTDAYRSNLAALMVMAHLYGCTVADLDAESGRILDEALQMVREQEEQGICAKHSPATREYLHVQQLILGQLAAA
jgi:transcriptional regulator with XRE-family HTH domain